jgi:gamma-glutamyl AIG2-like cyclotransferase
MDNRRDISGYKYFVDPETGARPQAFVVFLNLRPARGDRVNGVLFEADDGELADLDGRERNYARTDVSGCLSDDVSGKVWTYIGTDDAVGRFERGRRETSAVISRDYYEGVTADFNKIGRTALAEFERSTDSPPCPIVELKRIDLR